LNLNIIKAERTLYSEKKRF